MAVVGDAPCQCFSPAGNQTTSPGRISSMGPPDRCARPQPAVSQHLASLKEAGLVKGRREGRCVYYRVQPRGMKPLIDWIAHYRAFWTEHVNRLQQLLEKMDE